MYYRLVLRHDIYYYGCMSLLRSLDGKSIKMRTLMIDLPLPSFLVIFKGVETSTIFRVQGEPYKLLEKLGLYMIMLDRKKSVC